MSPRVCQSGRVEEEAMEATVSIKRAEEGGGAAKQTFNQRSRAKR